MQTIHAKNAATSAPANLGAGESTLGAVTDADFSRFDQGLTREDAAALAAAYLEEWDLPMLHDLHTADGARLVLWVLRRVGVREWWTSLPRVSGLDLGVAEVAYREMSEWAEGFSRRCLSEARRSAWEEEGGGLAEYFFGDDGADLSPTIRSLGGLLAFAWFPQWAEEYWLGHHSEEWHIPVYEVVWADLVLRHPLFAPLADLVRVKDLSLLNLGPLPEDFTGHRLPEKAEALLVKDFLRAVDSPAHPKHHHARRLLSFMASLYAPSTAVLWRGQRRKPNPDHAAFEHYARGLLGCATQEWVARLVVDVATGRGLDVGLEITRAMNLAAFWEWGSCEPPFGPREADLEEGRGGRYFVSFRLEGLRKTYGVEECVVTDIRLTPPEDAVYAGEVNCMADLCANLVTAAEYVGDLCSMGEQMLAAHDAALERLEDRYRFVDPSPVGGESPHVSLGSWVLEPDGGRGTADELGLDAEWLAERAEEWGVEGFAGHDMFLLFLMVHDEQGFAEQMSDPYTQAVFGLRWGRCIRVTLRPDDGPAFVLSGGERFALGEVLANPEEARRLLRSWARLEHGDAKNK